MKEIQLTEQLRHLPWTREHKQFFLSKLQPKKIKAMDILLKEGENCEFEAFVEKGILRSFYVKNEEERINQFFFEGQWVADYNSFLSNTPSTLNIQALEDCELLVVAKSDIALLRQELPEWDALGKVFFEKLLLKKERRNASLLLESAEEKYLTLVKNHAHLINRIPQYYIAQYIGIKPESLSRIRKKLTQNNGN